MFDEAFWVLIAFIIFVSIAFRPGKKMIVSALDERTEGIKKRLQEAENIVNEAKEIADTNAKKLQDAKKEVEKILLEAKQDAEAQKKTILENLSNSMKRHENQLKDRIQKNEKEAIEALRKIISSISINASESFLRENIDDKLHKELIKHSFSELPKNIQ
jgi:F-type H+-transporting ATPase subunit b|tara:strand:- start:482 stop:961 length:480 start_codon:yes stop_codon:yes gene_type:complete